PQVPSGVVEPAVDLVGLQALLADARVVGVDEGHREPLAHHLVARDALRYLGEEGLQVRRRVERHLGCVGLLRGHGRLRLVVVLMGQPATRKTWPWSPALSSRTVVPSAGMVSPRSVWTPSSNWVV